MAKERSHTRSRAVKRLQPYNCSPRGHSRDAGEERGESSHASAHHHSRSRSPSHTLFNPPDWAKKLLKQQQGNAAELKWLQGKLTGAKSHKNQQPHAVDSKFRFPGNKKHYFLKKMYWIKLMRPSRLMTMRNVREECTRRIQR